MVQKIEKVQNEHILRHDDRFSHVLSLHSLSWIFRSKQFCSKMVKSFYSVLNIQNITVLSTVCLATSHTVYNNGAKILLLCKQQSENAAQWPDKSEELGYIRYRFLAITCYKLPAILVRVEYVNIRKLSIETTEYGCWNYTLRKITKINSKCCHPNL